MPLGGIGCGSVSLGGNGAWRDWELFNRPAKGFIPCSSEIGPCVLLHMERDGEPAVMRLAEGPLDFGDYEGFIGSIRPNHGLPRFRDCSFHCAYPLGQVHLRDKSSPLDVRVEAFSPVIPGDADHSSLPVIQIRYVLENKTAKAVKTAVIANVPNFIGVDPKSLVISGAGKYSFSGAADNRNEFVGNENLQGIVMRSDGVDPHKESWGTIALTTHATADVSHRTAWAEPTNTEVPLLDFLNDLASDGRLDERENRSQAIPQASLAVHVDVPARGTREVTFFLTWHFPNRISWTKDREDIVGNWYTTRFADAWDVAAKVVPHIGDLERQTVDFVRAFAESDLPSVVKEAMLCNLANLFTETCHRLPDGTFCGWEGCADHHGLCEGTATHVWNYEQALAFLFGSLALSAREKEFSIAMGGRGDMVFRIQQPFDACPRQFKKTAADGQMGCIMKLYRDWQMSGDSQMLRRLWPNARKALEYCWIEGGWDADGDGVMEGCQHNTMDVEYYGPNPLMQFWYLGALRATEEMARYLDETDFASRCRALFERGSRWTDEHLFNGDYYEQRFQLPADAEKVPAEQRLWPVPESDKQQLLDACLVDQTVGQVMSHICGLGYLAKPSHIRKTLRSIMKYNARKGFHDHFNIMRSYVLGDESGLLMASYPRTPRPDYPFPYFTEVMTGFEYAAAAGMIYEGQIPAGLRCIRNIRSRYDGLKRSPFDEAECGHHYARAMASWAAGIALTGFRYSAVTRTMSFNADDGTWFWSNGHAWGTCRIKRPEAEVEVLFGKLALEHFELAGYGKVRLSGGRELKAGDKLRGRISKVVRDRR